MPPFVRLVTYGSVEHRKWARAQNRRSACLTLLGDGLLVDPDTREIAGWRLQEPICAIPAPPDITTEVTLSQSDFDTIASQYATVRHIEPTTVVTDYPPPCPIDRVFEVSSAAAKRIIRCVEAHGFGNWSALAPDGAEEELKHFVYAAVVLHFRAIDPSLVTNFPLLVRRLLTLSPRLDLSDLTCKDPALWFPRSHHPVLLFGPACRGISAFIHKRTVRFLSNLETHLMLQQWRNCAVPFPFTLLPPNPESDPQTDRDLYEDLLANPSSVRHRRAQDILSLVKRGLIVHRGTDAHSSFPFWTKPEIDIVIDIIANFGESVLALPSHLLHAFTGLLSKSNEQVHAIFAVIVQALALWTAPSSQPLVVPSFIPNPTEISISPDQCALAKRGITIINALRTAQAVLLGSGVLHNQPIEDGKGWWTIQHSLLLFDLLASHGIRALYRILVSDVSFRKHLGVGDARFLETQWREYLSPDQSLLPSFLLSEDRFDAFLGAICGGLGAKSTMVSPGVRLAPPVFDEPDSPGPGGFWPELSLACLEGDRESPS
jgi:hypothetical protein